MPNIIIPLLAQFVDKHVRKQESTNSLLLTDLDPWAHPNEEEQPNP